jgi:hypothetical protein
MTTERRKPSVLLIDDKEPLLESLQNALARELGDTAEIKTWRPSEADTDPLEKLATLVDENTVLVATDFDLTSGMRGLFGLTIVGWCQQRSIPVGDFSRGNIANLPKEPSLFELRIPSDEAEGARFIASTFNGLSEIGRMLEADPQIIASKRSLAAVLAALLNKPQIESQFALYMSRLGAANASLLETLKRFIGTTEPPASEKKRLLTYVLGHVLLNAILKYPGPILSEKALCAYVATSDAEASNLFGIFSKAIYAGPFGHTARYYWREDVDETIDELASDIDEEQFEMVGDLNRRAVEKKLGRALATHDCDRCDGHQGGFLCPFTQRPVCLRADCSVAASSWIPQGAQLCRVERVFYDEWAPLLGL